MKNPQKISSPVINRRFLNGVRNKINEFNIVIAGVGGQGLLTLLEIMARAVLKEGYDIKTSELHGLSQRGGSVEVHIRFGKKIFSPLVSRGKANLIISLEAGESLMACHFASKESKTIFLVNDFFIPIPEQEIIKTEKILKMLQNFSSKTILVPASEICQKELGTNVTAGIFLLGFALYKGLMPLKQDSVIKAIKEIIPEKHLDLNLKTLELAKMQKENGHQA